MIKIQERPQLWYQPGRDVFHLSYLKDRYRIFIPNEPTKILWNTELSDNFQDRNEIACYDVKHNGYGYKIYHKTSVKESIKRAMTFDYYDGNPKMEFICYLD